MKKLWNSLILSLAALIAVSCSVAPASEQTLRVATGSAKGTYSTMFKELAAVCGTEVPLVGIPSSS